MLKSKEIKFKINDISAAKWLFSKRKQPRNTQITDDYKG